MFTNRSLPCCGYKSPESTLIFQYRSLWDYYYPDEERELFTGNSNYFLGKPNLFHQKMENEEFTSNNFEKEFNFYFKSYKEKSEIKSSDMSNSVQSSIRTENKNDLDDSQPDNTKKFPASFDESATSEKNKINSKPEEEPSVNEKQIKNIFENVLKYILLNINEEAKILKGEELKIPDINIKDINQLESKEPKVKDFYNFSIRDLNKINELIQKEKKLDESKCSLIEFLLNLEAIKALEKFLDESPFGPVGGKEISLNIYNDLKRGFHKKRKNIILKGFKELLESKIEIKEEPKKLQQNFGALSQSDETLKEGEFICPNENKVDVEKKVHFDQPDHKTQTTNFSSKKFLTKKIYKQKKYRLNSNLIGITEGQKGKKKQKHDGSFADNLRKKALRKGLKSFGEKILEPKIVEINKEKKILGRKTKNILWKPNILDKDASSLEKLKDFAKRSMKDIYENLEPKHCSSKGINKNKDNIKKVYESSESIKDLFDLEFIDVIKIYLDKNNNNLDKKIIDLFKDDFSFDKDFEEDKNKNKRKKVIEKFIESVENDKNVESDKQKSKQ